MPQSTREEGIETVLVNPNIATIQTDPRLSGKVYLLPVTPEYVERVIEKERPDGILLGFGGQTALNCGLELDKKGILQKYNVKVLGTPIHSIEDTGDRERFRQAMLKANVPPLNSKSATSVEQALKVAGRNRLPSYRACCLYFGRQRRRRMPQRGGTQGNSYTRVGSEQNLPDTYRRVCWALERSRIRGYA